MLRNTGCDVFAWYAPLAGSLSPKACPAERFHISTNLRGTVLPGTMKYLQDDSNKVAVDKIQLENIPNYSHHPKGFQLNVFSSSI